MTLNKEFIIKYENYFNKMDNIYYKIRDFEKYISDNSKKLLNEEELKLINKFYDLFKNEIETIETSFMLKINKNNWKRSNYIKTLSAWEKSIFIRDKRTFLQLFENVEKGWKFEDYVLNRYQKLGLKVELSGSDSNRIHSLFSFNSTPDLIINGIYVEVQFGDNCFFKENKLNSNIQKDSFILYYLTKQNKYYLFSPNELIEISKNKSTNYGFKKGSFFDKNNFAFDSFNKVNQKLLMKIVKNIA